MHLTSFTDFGLRALMRLAGEPARAFTTEAMARELGISRHHLTKVVRNLATAGFVATRRGAGGGFHLARPAELITLGEIVRALEFASSAGRVLPRRRRRLRADAKLPSQAPPAGRPRGILLRARRDDARAVRPSGAAGLAREKDCRVTVARRGGSVCASRHGARSRHRHVADRFRMEDVMTGDRSGPPEIRLKRVYDPPAASDGLRVLVDRIWPRGLSKEKAAWTSGPGTSRRPPSCANGSITIRAGGRSSSRVIGAS